jgi:hypothetical protein
MTLNPFRYLETLSYRRRVTRYNHRVQLLFDDRTALEDLPGLISEFWRLAVIDDFLNITPQRAMAVQFNLRHKTLPALIDVITEFNDLLANGKDGLLETMMKNTMTERGLVILDTYLADENQFPIDIRHTLVRLQGVLLHHRYLLELQTSTQYYHRLAERIYNEVRLVTRALVATITEEAGLSSTQMKS